RALLAQTLLDFQIQVLSDLLADGQRRVGAGRLRGGADFEGVDAERVADFFREAARERAGRKSLRALRERDLLPLAQCVQWLVEHDEGEDVALFERRYAR